VQCVITTSYHTNILDTDSDDEDDNSPPYRPAPACDTHGTTATEANTDHETVPKLFSCFNPGHSGIATKEKRNINKNETHNDFKGDLMQHKDHETFRLFFDNQNGFNLTSKGAAFKELCEDQLLLQANYGGIAEPCLDTNKYQVRQTLHDIAKQTFQSYALDMASSPVTAANNYQPGRVMSIMHGHMIGRIKSRGNDKQGRWTYIKLLGRSDKVITLISAYQVCVNARTGTTAYHQQQSALIQCGADHFGWSSSRFA
jgi:hypothetical protein